MRMSSVKIVLAWMAVGLAAGLAVSALFPSRFEASTRVALSRGPGQVEAALSRESVREMVERLDVYATERRQLTFDDVLLEIRRGVTVRNLGAAEVDLTFVHADQTTARRIVESLAAAMGTASGPLTESAEHRITRATAVTLGLLGGLLGGLATWMFRARNRLVTPLHH